MGATPHFADGQREDYALPFGYISRVCNLEGPERRHSALATAQRAETLVNQRESSISTLLAKLDGFAKTSIQSPLALDAQVKALVEVVNGLMARARELDQVDRTGLLTVSPASRKPSHVSPPSQLRAHAQ